uniref:C3H1-type domain-containing protein n=1 Tax=Panagrolaimus sp. JU765 TaxID=591449 RepID=A0AC34QEM1_9BILA
MDSSKTQDDSPAPRKHVTFHEEQIELLETLRVDREIRRTEYINNMLGDINPELNFAQLNAEEQSLPLLQFGALPSRLPSPRKTRFDKSKFRNSRELHSSNLKSSNFTSSVERPALCPIWLSAGECLNRENCRLAHGTNELLRLGPSQQTPSNFEPKTSFKTSIVDRVQKVFSKFKSSKGAGHYDLTKSK